MNKEQVYDGEIRPLMDAVIAACKRAGIACFCTFDISTDTDGLICSACIADGSGAIPWPIRLAHAAVVGLHPVEGGGSA